VERGGSWQPQEALGIARRHDQGERCSSKTVAGGVLNGRDSISTSLRRALGRAQLRALGLHLSASSRNFRNRRDFLLPDRATVTMDRSFFLKSYVGTCLIKDPVTRARARHAMGGMAAQIPIRDDPQANEGPRWGARGGPTSSARGARPGTTAPGSRILGWRRSPARRLDAVHAPGRTSSACLRAEVNGDATGEPCSRCPEGEITESRPARPASA